MKIRTVALITALSILLMAVAAGFAMSQVFNYAFTLQPSQLVDYLQSSKTPYLAACLAWLLILVCDFIASWGLFAYYKNANYKRAIVVGSLRLIYSLVLAVAVYSLFKVHFLIDHQEVDAELVYHEIQAFQSIWQAGLIIFGFHLIALSPLVCKKKNVLQVIAIMLFVAGFGYSLSNTIDLFIEDYELMRAKVEMAFILPMVLGEIGLAFWLLIKGGRTTFS